jgi:hypothetical protein
MPPSSRRLLRRGIAVAPACEGAKARTEITNESIYRRNGVLAPHTASGRSNLRTLRRPRHDGRRGPGRECLSRGRQIAVQEIKVTRDKAPEIALSIAQLGAASAENDRDLVLGDVAGLRLELEIRGYETARAFERSLAPVDPPCHSAVEIEGSADGPM